jgi:Icc-related predicted phosphoesterase
MADTHVRTPEMSSSPRDVVRIAAIADLHYSRTAQGSLQPLFTQMASVADVLLICGDLTDYGLVEEVRQLAKELTTSVKIPTIAVLGNHDYEAGQQDEIRKVLTDSGVIPLDGDTCEVHGIGFAGIKGFAGGFGRGTLGPWGEEIIKLFVREAVNEALKLESALARLRSDRRIALLHYSPIAETVEGEPLEIYPYLGSSRLEEPLTRYPVTAVFHGHAHHGRLEGRTRAGVPVFNVSLPLMRQRSPDQPFRLIEVHMTGEPLGSERRSGAERRGAA